MKRRRLFRLIEVETRNDCTRRCWYCLHGQRAPVTSQRMPDELIEKIIQELGTLRYAGILNWFSANEPLLDDRMDCILRRTAEIAPLCRTRLFTNGDLLTQERLDALFASGLSELRISAHDKVVHRRVLGLNLRDYFIRITQYYNRPIAVFHNRSGLIRQLNGDTRWLTTPCRYPHIFMVIRYDGVLKLCCEDLTGRTFDPSLNCRDHSLRDLWCSPQMEHYRQLLSQGRRAELPICCDCDWHPDRTR